jgi:Gram-negative bacterial TonB protein C-terminal
VVLAGHNHYSSIGRGRFGAALAVSLLAHALPAMLLGRIYLAEPTFAPRTVFTVVELARQEFNPNRLPQLSGVSADSAPKVKEPPVVRSAKPSESKSQEPLFVQTEKQVVVGPPKVYFSAAQLDQQPDLLVPLDPSFFSDDYGLSGSITLELAINSAGTIDRIEVVSVRADEKFREKIIEWLRDKRFNPARKDGKPVDSLFRFELDLAQVDKPFEGIPMWPMPGHLPKLDARGNPIPDGPATKSPK